jgi:hypothetical protein
MLMRGAMVEIVVTGHPDRDGLIRAMRLARRRTVRLTHLMAAGYVAFGVAWQLLIPNVILRVAAVPFVLIGLSLPLVQWVAFRLALRRNLLRQALPQTVSLTDRGFEVASSVGAVRLDWRATKCVDLIPGVMLIRLTPRRFVAVPTVGLTGEEIGEITAALTRVPWGRETMAA